MNRRASAEARAHPICGYDLGRCGLGESLEEFTFRRSEPHDPVASMYEQEINSFETSHLGGEISVEIGSITSADQPPELRIPFRAETDPAFQRSRHVVVDGDGRVHSWTDRED